MASPSRVLVTLCVALALPAAAFAQDQLTYSKSYTVVGDYVAAGVDVNPKNAKNGFVTGTINISGVPKNADIVAVFLYWETVTSFGATAPNASFRGNKLLHARKVSQELDPSAAPCFGSGAGTGPYEISMFQADVLHYLPPQLDEKSIPTGKRLVNADDLKASGLGGHEVTLPQANGGNTVPLSAGATLFIVYVDPDETKSLRHIVVYDGAFVELPNAGMTKTIGGFLQAADPATGRMTQIVGSGAPNPNEFIRVGNAAQTPSWQDFAPNPFEGSTNTSSDRGWTTYNINPTIAGSNNFPYGDVIKELYG